jgi:hypothetical protein
MSKKNNKKITKIKKTKIIKINKILHIKVWKHFYKRIK